MTDPDSTVRDVVTDSRTEATRADQKATALFALVGLALGGLYHYTQQPMPKLALGFGIAAALPLTYALVRLLLCIRPRLTSTVPGTWLDAAINGPSSLYEAVTDAVPDESALHARCVDASRVALVTRIKFGDIRFAVDSMLLAGALLAVSVVLKAAL